MGVVLQPSLDFVARLFDSILIWVMIFPPSLGCLLLLQWLLA